MENKSHRQLLTNLGFKLIQENSSQILAANLKKIAQQSDRLDLFKNAEIIENMPITASFMEQTNMSRGVEGELGVSVTASDDSLWTRNAPLTESERDQLIEAGFENKTLLDQTVKSEFITKH